MLGQASCLPEMATTQNVRGPPGMRHRPFTNGQSTAGAWMLVVLMTLSHATMCSATQSSIDLNPSKDTTIYSKSGSLSNALGEFLPIGRTGDDTSTNYALMQFDISSIPSTAVIDNATLSLYQDRGGGAPNYVDLTMQAFRLNKAWGQGTSNVCSCIDRLYRWSCIHICA